MKLSQAGVNYWLNNRQGKPMSGPGSIPKSVFMKPSGVHSTSSSSSSRNQAAQKVLLRKEGTKAVKLYCRFEKLSEAQAHQKLMSY